jgi:polyhydroxyalkanoate synthesis regulator phasin
MHAKRVSFLPGTKGEEVEEETAEMVEAGVVEEKEAKPVEEVLLGMLRQLEQPMEEHIQGRIQRCVQGMEAPMTQYINDLVERRLYQLCSKLEGPVQEHLVQTITQLLELPLVDAGVDGGGSGSG